MGESTDRIEKQVLLHAPIERVWRAISDAESFGAWFGVRFDGGFAAGARLTGRIEPTQVDTEVAKAQEPHRGALFQIEVGGIEPMRRFSFRWHPFAVDPAVDYSAESPTLVAFELEATADGTRLTISESGFDRIPLSRRAQAYKANDGGWSAQARLIEKYLARTP